MCGVYVCGGGCVCECVCNALSFKQNKCSHLGFETKRVIKLDCVQHQLVHGESKAVFACEAAVCLLRVFHKGRADHLKRRHCTFEVDPQHYGTLYYIL